jgi:phytanoyl-CoA hydroxylase
MMEPSVSLGVSGAVVAPPDHAPHGQFSADELADFEQHGFVIARKLADAETCRQMLECTQATLAAPFGPVEYEADLHYPGAPGSRAATGGNTIRRLKEVHGRHPVFTRFVSQPSLVRRLQQLLGPHVVMPLAHHNCVMTKQPRYSSETGWHQDIRYWSYERPELISIWLALGRETPENGCLYLIPGTHTLPVSRDRLDDALFLRTDLAENAALISQKVPAVLDPGDVLFFHCRTFHAAGRNQTSETKFSAVFTFRPADNPPNSGSRSAAMPELLLPQV